MPHLDFEIDVPFVANAGRRCVPACAAMILKTLLPEQDFTQKQVEDLCGFRPDRSTWAVQHLLSLHNLGIRVGWIQDEDVAAFAKNPELYMRRQIPEPEEFEQFTKSNDIELEASRIQTYLDSGLTFIHGRADQNDITTGLLRGEMIRLEVNGKRLAEQEGYMAHAVVVSGFSDQFVRLENPDGVYGSKPRQIITWETLYEAWEDPILQYYKVED